MAPSRLPVRKFLRELRDMHTEFDFWSQHYARIAQTEWSVRSAEAYAGRAEILIRASVQLQQVFNDLERLPRLS